MSMITSGQITQIGRVAEAAAKTAAEEAALELGVAGVLTDTNTQPILAQGGKIAIAVKAVVKTVLFELANNVVGRLKRIFAERTIELAETDGKETLAEAGDVFTSGVYGAVKRGSCKATPKTLLAVYEMIKDGTFSQIFGGFGENLKRLCLTEAQIVAFCRDPKNREVLCGKYEAFFLFEGENGDFSVTSVSVSRDGSLYGHVSPITHASVFLAKYLHRLVVPQLES